jgi:hypothetical protein
MPRQIRCRYFGGSGPCSLYLIFSDLVKYYLLSQPIPLERSVTANIGSPLESALCWFLQEFVKQICWVFWWFRKKQHQADSKGDLIFAATDLVELYLLVLRGFYI